MSRDASNSLVIETVFVSLSTINSILSLTFLLFHYLEHLAELLETRLPNLPVLLQPFVDLFHFFDLQSVVNFSAFVFLFDKFTLRQNAQMFRNCLPASVKMLRNSVWRHRMYRYQRNDRSPRRVGNGLENISFHDFEYEYATKRLQMSSATERFHNIFSHLLANQNEGGILRLGVHAGNF